MPDRFKNRVSKSRVALHPEGVDRNGSWYDSTVELMNVALHPEGVDRNKSGVAAYNMVGVALHPEGVDRNVEVDT